MSISEENTFRELLVDDKTSLHIILDKTRDKVGNAVEIQRKEQQHPSQRDTIVKCSFCEIKFKSARGKEAHERVHYTFVCDFCFTVFGRESDLNYHLKIVHMKSMIDTCYSAKGKEEHEKLDYTFVCDFCFSVFSRKSDLDNHLKISHMKRINNTDSFTETVTDVTLQTEKNKSNLTHFNTKQMRSNKEDTKSTFKTLEKSTSNKHPEKLMMKEHSQIDVKPLLQAVTRHDPIIAKAISNMFFKQDSADDKNFPTKKWCCSVCGKTFLDKGHAMDHGEKHVSGLCYPCTNPGCGKWYQESVGLRGHKRQCRFIPDQAVQKYRYL